MQADEIIISLIMQDAESRPEQEGHVTAVNSTTRRNAITVFVRLYDLFGSLLGILIIIYIVLLFAVVVLRLFNWRRAAHYWDDLPLTKVQSSLEVVILLAFIAALYYLASGLIKRQSGNKAGLLNAKIMILRGIAGTVVLILLYLCASVINASLFGVDVYGGYSSSLARI